MKGQNPFLKTIIFRPKKVSLESYRLIFRKRCQRWDTHGLHDGLLSKIPPVLNTFAQGVKNDKSPLMEMR